MKANVGHPEALDLALARTMRQGWPVPEQGVPEELIELLGVVARSIHPDIRLSRIDALNRLVPDLIDTIEHEPSQLATRILFGLQPGSSGTTLTARRHRAASVLEYDPDHFRKHIEPQLRRAVALRLHRDSLRYKSRVKRAPAALEPTGDTPKLQQDDLTHQEELVSRIWQHVYELRAELIAVGRLSDQPEYASMVEDHRQAAGRAEVRLQELIREYVESYGDDLIRHGESEYALDGLARLVGWRLGTQESS